MDFEYSPQLLEFRDEVRTWIRANLPAHVAERVSRGYYTEPKDLRAWMAKLYDKGWAAPHWPVEYGGTGWSALQQHIFHEECVYANAPPAPMANLSMAGPVIYSVGSDDQKARFLKPMIDGEHLWCQGFSEPNAGSDLASLRTSAVLDGDHYVVNGQKIWNSRADKSDWSFTLVRTDASAKKQKGISFLLIDMKSPGITVRPIKMITGETYLCETFYNDVRVPVENRVGEEGLGWTYAKTLLGRERTASAEVPTSKRDLRRLRAYAALSRGPEGPLIDDPTFRRRVDQVEIDLIALETSVLRVLSEPENAAAPVASVLKIRGSEMRQRLHDLIAETLQAYGVVHYPDPDRHDLTNVAAPGPAHAPGVMHTLMHRRAATIYGGSNEVQRNIIARNVLGL